MSGNVILTDGALNYTAEVDARRRLKTTSVSMTSGTDAAINEDQYSISPPIFAVTGEIPVALLFLENTDNVLWEATVVELIFGENDGTSDWIVEFFKNDLASDIKVSGTDFLPVNMNMGSAKTLSSISKFGGNGFSFDGTPALTRLIPNGVDASRIPLDSVIMPPGSNVGVSVTPPAGNTTMNIDVAFTIIRETQI